MVNEKKLHIWTELMNLWIIKFMKTKQKLILKRKGEVGYCLNNGKSFEKMVKSKVC